MGLFHVCWYLWISCISLETGFFMYSVHYFDIPVVDAYDLFQAWQNKPSFHVPGKILDVAASSQLSPLILFPFYRAPPPWEMRNNTIHSCGLTTIICSLCLAWMPLIPVYHLLRFGSKHWLKSGLGRTNSSLGHSAAQFLSFFKNDCVVFLGCIFAVNPCPDQGSNVFELWNILKFGIYVL